MWLTSFLVDAFARAFCPPPDEPIWKWAEAVVWLEQKDAAESGYYRSAKTPWTRRLQELARDSRMFVVDYSDPAAPRWTVVPVNEINEKKSSQSGVSEACLNVIRWRATFRPCNFIYTMDTREEARNIIERLTPSLRKIDPDIFTENADDVGALILRLRAMIGWFVGSFSKGKFANKQAGIIVNDELEEHKRDTSDTSTDRSVASRKKTVEEGLQFNISKPRLRGGPICKCFDRGNQEEFHIRCPSCGTWQWFTFFPEKKQVPFSAELVDVEIDGLRATLPVPLPLGEIRTIQTGRVVIEHCRNHLGEWDLLRVLREAYHECGHCQQPIPLEQKASLIERALWLPTAIGTPGIVSQHINDLYSTDAASSLGRIALDFLDANKEGRLALQGFYNHRCGLEFREEAHEIKEDDLRANIAGQPGDIIPAYGRGTCPFIPNSLILGSDIGGNYAKWALIAVHENTEDAAVIDWGEELDPDDIAELILQHTWPCGPDRKPTKINFGFMDTKFRKRDCFRACLKVPGFRLIPTAGLGGTAARTVRLWTFTHIPAYGKNFRQLAYNDREAKNELYIDCLKKKKTRLYFPSDLAHEPPTGDVKEFIAELTAERMLLVDGAYSWDEKPPPNHYGDCVKDALTGLRFLTRKNRRQKTQEEEDGETSPAPGLN